LATFLRDRHIRNLTISKARIDEFYALCNTHATELIARGVPGNEVHVKSMIRFDEKGYTVFRIEDIHQCYDQAHEIERIVFTIETQESLNTNRRLGSFLEINLDKNYHLCFLTVASDDRVWVEAAFSSFNEVIIKSRSNYAC